MDKMKFNFDNLNFCQKYPLPYKLSSWLIEKNADK